MSTKTHQNAPSHTGRRRPTPRRWVTKKFVLKFRKNHIVPDYDGLVVIEALEIAHDWLAMDRMLRDRDRVIAAAWAFHQRAPWTGTPDHMRALKDLDAALAALPSGVSDSEGKP